MPFDPNAITTGKKLKPPRICLIGTEKVGKSTWAAGAPKPLFIQVKGETGLDRIDAHKTAPIQSYQELMDVFLWLATAEHDYQTVVIDSGSTLCPMILDKACEDHKCGVKKLGGGYGEQENVLVSYARTIMDALDYLRDARAIGCVIICHTKANPKTFNDPETDPYDTWKVELRDSIASAFFRWADAILFATFKKYVRDIGEGNKKVTHAVGNGERVIYTEKRPAFTAGCRYPIPFELPMTYTAFINAYTAAA